MNNRNCEGTEQLRIITERVKNRGLNMSRKGVLAVVSGFSGAGKGTLMKALLSEHADQYALSISATTRGPREGEVDGREYFFKTKDQFE